VKRRRYVGEVFRLAFVLALVAWPLSAQEADRRIAPDSARPKRGSEFLIPVTGLVPGLPQYIHGAYAAGAAYTATAVAGIAVHSRYRSEITDTIYLPRTGSDQLAEQGLHVVGTTEFVGAWDAFHRAIPSLQRQGKYEFLHRRENVGQLISAPFDIQLLKRWTTWVGLSETMVVTALVLGDRGNGEVYAPFRGHDGVYLASNAMNAAVGEEALFRGYLLPLLHQHTGRRFWVANGIQASLFGAVHVPEGAGLFALEIGASSLFEGWVTRRNDWSIRESIFHHFWYDAVVGVALFLRDTNVTKTITFPAIAF
jgi:hypothetical protein